MYSNNNSNNDDLALVDLDYQTFLAIQASTTHTFDQRPDTRNYQYYSHPAPSFNFSVDPATSNSLAFENSSPLFPSPSSSALSGAFDLVIPNKLNANQGPSAPTSRTITPNSPLKSMPPPTAKPHVKRKRNRNHTMDNLPESDSDSDASGQEKVPRVMGACNRCRKLKIKCEFVQGQQSCRRCEKRGHLCVVEGSKHRIAPKKREYLLAQLREKDALIQSLLKQLHNPHLATPLFMANSRSNNPHRGPGASRPVGASDSSNLRDIQVWIEKARLSAAGGAIGSSAGELFTTENSFEELDHSDGEAGQVPGGGSDWGESDHEGVKKERRPGSAPPSSNTGSSAPSYRNGKSSPKLHSLPAELAPLGLIANLSLSASKGRRSRTASAIDAGEVLKAADVDSASAEEEDKVGLANDMYFKPGPATNPDLRRIIIENQMAPEILTSGLITPAEVEILFKIFFEKINVSICLLDPAIHTPSAVYGRCPFLFTAVCAIASRFYTKRPELYNLAMHFAKSSAASTLIDGWKSIELVQGYILMSIFPLPARRWEEDRSWLYAGLAIRMGTDLNLHQPTKTKMLNEMHEREILNRTRTWLTCFNIDRSMSGQIGRRITIKDDFIIHNVRYWYKRSKFNLPGDVHVVAYSMLGNIMSRFQDTIYSDLNAPTLLNTSLNFRQVVQQFDQELKDFWQELTDVYKDHLGDRVDPGSDYRCDLTPFVLSYSRLVVNSFGFQQVYLKEGIKREDILFTACLNAASSVLKVFSESLAPQGYLRYAPEGHFVFATFAAAFLIKLLKEEFAHLLDEDQQQRIIQLVRQLIHAMDSIVAVDDMHSPRLYARFLDNLLSKQTQAKVEEISSAIQGGGAPAKQDPPDTATSGIGNPRNEHHPSIDIIQAEEPDTPMPGEQTARAPIFDQSRSSFLTAQYVNQPHHTQYQPQQPSYEYSMPTGYVDSSFDIDQSSAMGTALAPMEHISNPQFWDNVMLPGFSWPGNSPQWDMPMSQHSPQERPGGAVSYMP